MCGHPQNGINDDDDDRQHLSSLKHQEGIKSVPLPNKGRVPFSFHVLQSGLWMDLGETDLEESGCGYVSVGGNKHPAALSLGWSWAGPGSIGRGERTSDFPLGSPAFCLGVSSVSL